MASIEGRLSELEIESTYLEGTIHLSVYQPPNYTPLKSYRLLICQDGQDFFRLGRIHRQVDELISEVEIEETIVVGIPYPSVETRRVWYHPEGEKNEAYCRFLACELLPFLEETFSVEPLAEARTLAGDSLAATVSLTAALQYPTLFKNVILFSPYVDQTVLENVQSFSKAEILTIFHSIGKKETSVKMTDGKKADFLTPNRKLNAAIDKHSFTYHYHEFEGDHTWTYWQKQMSDALQRLLPI